MNETPLTPPHTHINPARLVALVVVAVLSFGVGMYVGVSTGAPLSLMDKSAVRTGSFEEGYESARARLIERGIITDISTAQTDTLGGEVVRVEGDMLVLRIESADPLSDPYEVSIATNESTQVSKLSDLDPEEYESLFAEYTEEMQTISESENATPGAYPTPPDPFVRTQTSLSTITPGQFVTVVTTDPLPLSAPTRTAQTIEFREMIQVQEMPEIMLDDTVEVPTAEGVVDVDTGMDSEPEMVQ